MFLINFEINRKVLSTATQHCWIRRELPISSHSHQLDIIRWDSKYSIRIRSCPTTHASRNFLSITLHWCYRNILWSTVSNAMINSRNFGCLATTFISRNEQVSNISFKDNVIVVRNVYDLNQIQPEIRSTSHSLSYLLGHCLALFNEKQWYNKSAIICRHNYIAFLNKFLLPTCNQCVT